MYSNGNLLSERKSSSLMNEFDMVSFFELVNKIISIILHSQATNLLI